MKIAYIITRSDLIGGASLHVRDLAVAMQRRGHEVHVLVGGSEGLYFPVLEEAGLPYTKIPSLIRPIRPLTDWRCVADLMEVIKRLAPDVVHCHSSKAGILGRRAAYRLGLPSVFSAHGWSFTEGIKKHHAQMYRLAEKIASRWCDKILCGCERDRQLGISRGVADSEKIETIWYGLHNLEGTPLADPSADPPRMVMVARFEDQKDHETLLRALVKLRDLPWSLDLLGDGPLRSQNEKLAVDLAITDRVHFLGAQPTTDFLLRSQVFLLISNWEGLPLSTLEAMRVGLPLVGSDVGGIPEQIVEGESGFIIPRGDVELLATRLRTILSDPQLRVTFGKRGKERFDADFQYERMLSKVEAIYCQLAAKHSPRSLGIGRQSVSGQSASNPLG